jgi:hypothetical protein
MTDEPTDDDLGYLKARRDEIQVELTRLVAAMQTRAKQRETQRETMPPQKLEEFDAKTRNIQDAIAELEGELRVVSRDLKLRTKDRH